jgi:hypothetical protein
MVIRYRLTFVMVLPFLKCRIPTEDKLNTLPHIIMTSGMDWDPSMDNKTIDDMDIVL